MLSSYFCRKYTWKSFFFSFESLVNVVRQYVHAQIELLYRFYNVQEAEIGNGLLDAEIA